MNKSLAIKGKKPLTYAPLIKKHKSTESQQHCKLK